MLYVKYEEYKNKLHDSQDTFDSILSEKEELFSKTQPNATDYSKDKTMNGTPKNNPFETYVIKMQDKQVDERLNEARTIIEDRKFLLNSKEEELRNSKDWYDKIYTYKFIDKMSVEKIKNIMPYCRSSIYDKINEIEKKLGLDKNGQKL